MKQPKSESLRVDFKGKSVTGQFKVYNLRDGNFHICYVPSLRLSSYGDTLEEAKKMLGETLSEFFDALVHLPEYKAHEELVVLGWKRDGVFKKQFHSKSFVDKEGILRDFNLSPETVISETVLAV